MGRWWPAGGRWTDVLNQVVMTTCEGSRGGGGGGRLCTVDDDVCCICTNGLEHVSLGSKGLTFVGLLVRRPLTCTRSKWDDRKVASLDPMQSRRVWDCGGIRSVGDVRWRARQDCAARSLPGTLWVGHRLL